MRNFNVITNGLEKDSANSDVKCIYKEVVVVGNGPSGITLSYLLNGYRPYYNKIPHPDPMLSARLIECTQKSLLHQDLSFLSQGIEGRSKNPISLLVDAMTHPGADMGLEWPSLLTWKKTAKTLDHIVLGKGDPGGTWPVVPDHILTISPGRWMALPGLEFKEYHDKRAPALEVAKYYMEYVKKHDLTPFMATRSTVTMIQPLVCKPRKRARWKVWVTDVNGGTVSYECRHLVLATGSSDKAGCLEVPGESLSYVTHNLRHFEELLLRRKDRNLYNSSLSTSTSVDHADKISAATFCRSLSVPMGKSNGQTLPNGPQGGSTLHHSTNGGDSHPNLNAGTDANGWGEESLEGVKPNDGNKTLKSYRDIERDNYSLKFPNNHDSDAAKIPGNSFLREDEIWLDKNIPTEKEINVSLGQLDLTGNGFETYDEKAEVSENSNVLIVGAGLSAADAILAAWRKNCSVIHAFRNPLTSTKLPAVMYPEYHELYRLMQGLDTRKDYTPLPGHQVTEFSKDNVVELVDSSGSRKSVKVAAAAVLIGSHPDLSFLPKTLKNLGIDPNKPVDCKLNPIQIDPFSYKCVRAPAGLYALGPLVGDNFVRFLQGGAVAVAGHIFKDNNFHKNVK